MADNELTEVMSQRSTVQENGTIDQILGGSSVVHLMPNGSHSTSANRPASAQAVTEVPVSAPDQQVPCAYEAWVPLINQAIELSGIDDLSKTIPDIVGHWLVRVLGLRSPSMVALHCRVDPEDRYLAQLDPWVCKMVASRVIRSVGYQSSFKERVLEQEVKRRRVDPTAVSSAIEKSVFRMVGEGASDEIKEGALRFLDSLEVEQVKVHTLLRASGWHEIPMEMQPPRAAFMACVVAQTKAQSEGLNN